MLPWLSFQAGSFLVTQETGASSQALCASWRQNTEHQYTRIGVRHWNLRPLHYGWGRAKKAHPVFCCKHAITRHQALHGEAKRCLGNEAWSLCFQACFSWLLPTALYKAPLGIDKVPPGYLCRKEIAKEKMDNEGECLWSVSVSDFYVAEFMGYSC